MPRRKQAGLEGLYADIAAPTSEEKLLASTARDRRLEASLRGDLSGSPLNLMLNPMDYQQRVLRMWEAYQQDPFFKRLLDRVVDFVANGSAWEVPAELEQKKSWLDLLKDWLKNDSGFTREEQFWNTWSQMVNQGVPNVIPGMEEVIRWAVKHILLGGMFVPNWQLGTMRFGKQEFLVPTTLTCHSGASVALAREQSLFMSEQIYLRKPVVTGHLLMQEGSPAQIAGPAAGVKGKTPPGYDLLPPMSSSSIAGSTESWALKYNWSPGDLVSFRSATNYTGQGIYPQPPFISLLPQFAMRQKLFAADLAALDGFINYFSLWKIGDKDHPPQPPVVDPKGKVTSEGTIAQMRRLIQEGRMGPALEIFVPYYVDLEMKSPDPQLLLNAEKYAQSMLEIFAAFGIFFSRGTGTRERMERINISTNEEFMEGIRMCIRGFLTVFTHHIRMLNPGKLTQQPMWSPLPLNTKSEVFLTELRELAKIGRVSIRTLLRNHRLDDRVELPRIAQELATDTDDMTGMATPLSYVQTVQDDVGEGGKPNPAPAGPGKQTAISPGKQQGRPKKTTKAVPVSSRR